MKKPQKKTSADTLFRFYIGAVIGLVLAILCLLFFVVDQMAFKSSFRKSLFAKKTVEMQQHAPFLETEIQNAEPEKSVVFAEPAYSSYDKIPEGENGEPATTGACGAGEAAVHTDFGIEQKRLAELEELKAKLEEEERLRLEEEEKRNLFLAGVLSETFSAFPKALNFSQPQLSPFGTLEEAQFSPILFAEFAPLFVFADKLNLKITPLFPDKNWQLSLEKDPENGTWRLAANTLKLAKLTLNEDGLLLEWLPDAKNPDNLNAYNKLVFSILSFSVEHLEKEHTAQTALFTPTKSIPIDLKTLFAQPNVTSLRIPTLFSEPNWQKAFDSVDVLDFITLEMSVLSNKPENKNFKVEISGEGAMWKIDFTNAEGVVISIPVTLTKDAVILTDISPEFVNPLNRERAELRRKLSSAEDNDLRERLQQIEAMLKNREKAKLALRNANFQVHYSIFSSLLDNKWPLVTSATGKQGE